MIRFLQKHYIGVVFLTLLVWQLLSVVMMSIGVWPIDFALVNTFLLAAVFVLLRTFLALQLFLLSLPFMVALRGLPIENFPMWRVLLAWLFTVVVIKKIVSLWKQGAFNKKILGAVKQRLAPWDRWLYVLGIFAAMSVVLSVFQVHGAKQLLFLVNAYLLYVVGLIVLDTGEKFSQFKNTVLYSLLITVALGYIQYIATFYAVPYYFWQYWAVFVSSLYYGQPLADVLAYSNSWFSAGGAGQSLRMFGIMQDTHSFGVIVLFALGLWIALRARLGNGITKAKDLLKLQTREFWVVLVLLCFAVVASGTRGIWVAMLVPLGFVILASWRKITWRKLLVLPWIAYLAVIILFIISPWISWGFNLIRTFDTDDNFLDRAESIYDLDEASNVGRLQIWSESVKFAFLHPFGTGYGNFVTSLVPEIPERASFEEVSQIENNRYNLPQKFVTAHSLYLHILVELGLIGLGLLVVFWLIIAKYLYKLLAESSFVLNAQNMILSSIGLTLLWLLSYGVFDVTILNDRVLLYLMSLFVVLNLIRPNYQFLKKTS